MNIIMNRTFNLNFILVFFMSRIKQTKTDWQKAIDNHPNVKIGTISWIDKVPEFIHISIALVSSDYKAVREDFYTICDYVNSKHVFQRKFHFNFSHTIKLIDEDESIIEIINETCFKDAFQSLFIFYNNLLGIKPAQNNLPRPKLLLQGYSQILKGRSDTSILCKYIMMQYENVGRDDPMNLFVMTSTEEILDATNVSKIMALFPISTGNSQNMDLEFCSEIWFHNYHYSPFMGNQNNLLEEDDNLFSEFHLQDHTESLKELYFKFRGINLLAVYETRLAEIHMGFIARICNLSLDVIYLVKTHKSEIAEITHRSVLESFIVSSWLLKQKDVKLYQRFRDYSTGREKFFGESLRKLSDSPTIEKAANEIISDAIEKSGKRDIDISSEKGGVFNKTIAQMFEETWNQEKPYYFLYKKLSEVTHGHWESISKYHLVQSINPMHNGLYMYDEDLNQYSGIISAFMSLSIASETLIVYLTEIVDRNHDSEHIEMLKDLLTSIQKLSIDVYSSYMDFFNKYVLTR